MGTGMDHSPGPTSSTGGNVRSCQAWCCAVPVTSTTRHSASRPAGAAWDHGRVPTPAPPAVSAVPRRWRLACAAAAAVVVAVLAYVGLTLPVSDSGLVRYTT